MNSKVISISDVSYKRIAKFISLIKMINIIRYEHIVLYGIVKLDNSVIELSKIEITYSLHSFTDKYFVKNNIRNFLKEIIGSLEYLHNLSVFNCNINPHNVLMDDNNSVYLSDYLINSIRLINDIPISSLMYLSPEEIEEKELSEKSDVWSIGCLIYYILTEVDLFSIESIYLFINTIKSYKYSIHSIEITMEFEQIISKCLRSDCNERISLSELLIEINNSSSSSDRNIGRENFSLLIDNDVEINDDDYNIDNEILLNELIDSYHHYNNSKYFYKIIDMLLSNFSVEKKERIGNKIEYYNSNHDFPIIENADENLLFAVHSDYSLIYGFMYPDMELSYLVQSFKYLKSLRILKMNFSAEYRNAYRMIDDNLSLLPNLKSLSFQYIGDEGIKIMSNRLSLLTTLTINNQISLNFDYSGICNDGLYELSSKLSTLPNLEYLSLKGNLFLYVPDIFYDCINKYLSKLECLDFRRNGFEEYTILRLKKNLTSIKYLYLDEIPNKQE